MQRVKLLIIGAGPTGLGAAIRCHELGETNCIVLEAADHPGGLASSFCDDHGFTWDLGSHLQFSHYEYYDRVLDTAMPAEAWYQHRRSTWVWTHDSFIPYPFQMNLHHLPPQPMWECVQGLMQRPEKPAASDNFGEWCGSTFGKALTDLFMRPYNEKLWQCRLEDMGAMWVEERVAAPELSDVIRSICLKTEPPAWGPNAVFRYPKSGGTGSIWNAVANLLPESKLRLKCPVRAIDINAQIVTTTNGHRFGYEHLLSTVPLPSLAGLLGSPELLNSIRSLRSTRTHIVGLGMLGQPPASLAKQCWSYFPQDAIPFYRLTVLSNLSERCVPVPGKTWSLMAEIAEPHDGTLNCDEAVSSVTDALASLKLIKQEEVMSRWHKRLAFGYPVPTRNRNQILRDILPKLQSRKIFSRGRFGAWMYEISNQDHSFMQGVELVDRLLLSGEEPTLESALRSEPSEVSVRSRPLPDRSFAANSVSASGYTPVVENPRHG